MLLAASGAYTLAAVLGFAALGKVRDLRQFAEQVADYRIVPYRFTRPVAVLVISAELACTLLLLLPPVRRAGAAGAAVLFAAFFIALASVLARGLKIECACFGGAGELETVGPATAARTGLLFALAVSVAVVRPEAFRPVDLLAGGLIAALLFLLTELIRLGTALPWRVGGGAPTSAATGPRGTAIERHS